MKFALLLSTIVLAGTPALATVADPVYPGTPQGAMMIEGTCTTRNNSDYATRFPCRYFYTMTSPGRPQVVRILNLHFDNEKYEPGYRNMVRTGQFGHCVQTSTGSLATCPGMDIIRQLVR